MTASVDLIVVGGGPAGRALAHRAGVAGLRVTLIDPAPERAWHATYGLYADDVPAWLDPATVATRSAAVTVYTPHRRVVDRGYVVLDPEEFRRSLTVDDVVASTCTRVDAGSVTLADGSVRSARHVIDARGTAAVPASVPRQTAYGTFAAETVAAADAPAAHAPAETVLMDWRAAGVSALRPASFSYRVPTARGLLVEETCLAGSPPIPLTELRRRAQLRSPSLAVDSPVETVDFPLYPGHRPWQTRGALAFGAAGGLMNPATGYSVAQSLGAVDGLVEAIIDGHELRGCLWTWTARMVYRLQLIGLAVLLMLDAEQSVRFFDAFFRLPAARQRAYLSVRDDLGGTVLAMLAVFLRCPPRLQFAVAVSSARAAFRLRAG
ncbi:lycopene cyclase family protein [Gordonia hydrophobica]|uniref:Lycopene cyclase family protein n=1 Tax=Gordonia hydrophobica TaxID=40516 RepID=A0ABZ2TZY5_9ACTN|nr:lycopene cyclase family protein [Gordonia hydrophobica]MBM7369152.1 lycopene beta-cyclase [Gordonia hydrophobica]